MGLLDYYRQFDDVTEEELNRERRARRAREKALALARIPTLDLSRTEWPDFPNSEIVNASIAAARGRVNGYPDLHADRIRDLLAEHHRIDRERIVVGNGAAELLASATAALLGPDDELLLPWPSYPLFPLLAQRAGARPVPVELSAGRVDSDALLDAVTARTRAILIANPNDPTGTYLEAAALAKVARALPDRVQLLLDEAYIHFQQVEDEDACLRLSDSFPHVLAFRTFSKIYGLSGLRAGYAVGAPDSAELLGRLAPALGVNVLTQAGIAQALRIGDREIERRREMVCAERRRVLDALHELPADAPESQANFVWLTAAGLSGAELAARLERSGVIVAAGGPLGADDHVRATIRSPSATDRLVDALSKATGSSG